MRRQWSYINIISRENTENAIKRETLKNTTDKQNEILRNVKVMHSKAGKWKHTKNRASRKLKGGSRAKEMIRAREEYHVMIRVSPPRAHSSPGYVYTRHWFVEYIVE